MVLACHVISQEHVIRRSSDFMGELPSCQVWWSQPLGSGVKTNLVFHVIKESRDFMNGSPSW